MPIIYRPGKEGVLLKDLPLNWDGNRFDISSTNSKTQKAASAVCTFVNKSHLTYQRHKRSYHLNYPKTLERRLRDGAVAEAGRKQRALIKLFELDDQQKIDAKKQLAGFNEWAKPTTKVAAMFSQQVVPGTSTGFSIGENLVITAGHCVVDPEGNDPITDYYAVFGMTVELTRNGNFPEEQVYSVKRVIQRAFADDYDNPNAGKPSPLQPLLNIPLWTRKGVNYDCAVIELVGRSKSSLSQMTLKPSPVHTNMEVSLIGSPRGLPLKCSKGGRILEAIDLKWHDPANQPARPPLKPGLAENATFTVDVDSFPGNSGGPLVQETSPSVVVGITRSGVNFPFSDSSLSSTQVAPGRLTNEWARKQLLTKEAIAEAEALGFPLNKAKTKLGADIDASWLYGYEGVRLSNDAKYLYQHRFYAESAVIRNLNRFTRVDALSYFTSSLAAFRQAQRSDVPQVQSSLSIFFFWPDSHTMGFKGGLRLRINLRSAYFETDTLTPDPSTGWLESDSNIYWQYNARDTPAQPPGRLFSFGPGNIPHGACHSARGIADWESVEVIRDDNQAWEDTPTSLEHRASLSLDLQYKRLTDTSNQPRWGEEIFAFGVNLLLDTKKDRHGRNTESLIGVIGKLEPPPPAKMPENLNSRDEYSIWKGPKRPEAVEDAIAPFV
ncbi:unnamed protein product [Cercospora beticola]|nr:unnamed protein product [Cercospora beticola]